MNKQAEEKEIMEIDSPEPPCEHEEGPSCDVSDHPFDIGDQIRRILDTMNLSVGDGGGHGGGGIMRLLKRMTEPGILDALPSAGESMDDDDRNKMDGVHHKIVMIIGKPDRAHLDGDDLEDTEDVLEGTEEKAAAIRELMNVRMAARTTISPEDAAASARRLADAFYVALRCAERSTSGEPGVDDVVTIIQACNPIKHRRVASKGTIDILSGIEADASAYTDTPAFWKSIAHRIKLAYQDVMDENGGAMERAAFVVTRNPVEDFTGRQGFNVCPKFKTQTNRKASVPVEHSYCRDYCVEGRPEPDGTVTCKYAAWLETIDTHEKVMARYPELKNPANEDNLMNLPDGQRHFPRKANAYSIEQRMGQERLNNTKRDATTGMERQISEDKMAGRSEIGQFETTEEKLIEARGKRKPPTDITEGRLDDKRDDSSHGGEPKNAAEARLRVAYPEAKFDHRKLIDELLEDEFPRKDSKRPREA